MRIVMSRVAAWLAGLLAVTLLVQPQWQYDGTVVDSGTLMALDSAPGAGVAVLVAGVAVAQLLAGRNVWASAAALAGSGGSLIVIQALISGSARIVFGGIAVGVFLAAVFSVRPADPVHRTAVLAGIVTGFVAMVIARVDTNRPRRYADYLGATDTANWVVLGIAGVIIVTLLVAALVKPAPTVSDGDRRIVAGATLLALTGVLFRQVAQFDSDWVPIAGMVLAVLLTCAIALWLGSGAGRFLIVSMVVAGTALPLISAGWMLNVTSAGLLAVCVLAGVVLAHWYGNILAGVGALVLVAIGTAVAGVEDAFGVVFLFAFAASAGYAVASAMPTRPLPTVLGAATLFAGPVAAVFTQFPPRSFGWTAYGGIGEVQTSLHVMLEGAGQFLLFASPLVAGFFGALVLWTLARRAENN
ncbi:hypothetical protein [Hoyosella altamirensis]|uniref:Uncharacterized protein n=1 Tax=Hoyosella altamirensis TaxID=616997 RepID=A0A839RS50_9ACTN|nr:hypothetical protein [Hoyosella altamirensis]MBB3039685.1 hypothetical protein [Hoyosella altamirensis]